MSKMNKIITNNSVQLSESEVNNLIVTLGPVIEAFTGGGGGQGSVIYTPGDDNISINNTQHTIALSTDAAAKLNTPIPTKVSDLTDSANYATVDAINAKLDKDEFAALSGNFATEQYVQAVSAEVTGWVNNQHYLTQVPDTYYLKTETSGKDELSAAFNDILKYNVTGAAGIEITTATDNGTTTFGISMTAEPVVTDTTLSGYNGIAAAPDGAKSGWWNIGLTQAYKEQIEEVSSKLTKTDADTYYAPISVTGDVDTLKSSSGDWNKVSAKLDTSAFSSVSGKFISASYPFTADLGGGSKLSVTNGATAVFTNNASFSSFANTLIQGMANTTILGNSFCQGTSNTADGNSLAQGSVNYAKNTSIAQGSVNSAINCSQAFGVGNVITDTGMAIGKYNKTSSDASFVIGNGTNSNRSDLFIIKHDGTVSSTGDFIVDGKSLSSVYNTVSTNSGGWLKESDLNYYVTSSDITTQDTDYVMTTTGWKVLTLPGGGMTQVIHDATLTGQGNANDNKLGVAWSALSGNTIAFANSADVAMRYYDTIDKAPISLSQTIHALYNSLDSCLYTGDLMPDNGISGIYNSQAQEFELGLTQTAYNAVTSVSSKVDKPTTSLVDKYLVLRTDTNGAVSGWCDFQDQSYSKSEALGTFVATANIDTTTLSGDGKSVSTKLGVKTDVIATTDYVNSSFLPLSGGTVTGQLEVHGGSNFDSQFIKLTREGNSCGARIGLGSDTTNGTLALKTFNGQGQNTVQVNIKHNTNNNELIQVQKGGSEVGFLIPAVTSTTTAGLTNDGILHIILES